MAAEWQQVKEILYTALQRPQTEWPALLDSACGKNANLRSEVELLLDSYVSGFLEDPLFAETSRTRPSADPHFEQGRIIDHYKIVDLLGRGGMGEVYLAKDTTLDRLVAIKIIHPDSGFGEHAAERLLREAKAVAKIDHPNICTVHDVGEADGQPFIAMQYVEGETLDALFGADSITYDDAVSFARQIAAGLARAHANGVVHRDIKPANIIVDSSKQLKILDFGLAKETLLEPSKLDLSSLGLIAGTVAYMSPEHVRGQETTAQTDVWSLGVVFYQMLTGKLPFRGDNKADLIAAILHHDPEPVQGVSDSLNYILSRALQKDRADRYETIEEFGDDLAELAETGRVEKFARAAETATSGASRRLWRVAVPVILLLAMTGAGIGLWRDRVDGAAQPMPFASATSDSLQISSLYDVKRQPGAAITDLSFSPDGTMIAFGFTGSRTSQVFVQSVSGSPPVRITDEQSLDYSPVWSPDGKRIAYTSNREGKTAIWAIASTGGSPVHLVDLPSGKSGYALRKWSRDGRRIFLEYGEGPTEIDLATGAVSALPVSGIEGKIERGFAVSTDDSRILITATENGKKQHWVRSLDRNDAKRVSQSRTQIGASHWFPDGQRYAYSSDHSGNAQIYVHDLRSSESTQVTFGNFNSSQPVISPDGGRIVYVTNIDEANVASLDVATQTETMVTNNVNMHLFPTISPDGTQIAYQAINDLSKMMSGGLKTEDLKAGSVRTLLQSGCCIRWSPKGDELAYLRRSGPDLNIWKIGKSGDEEIHVSTRGVVPTAHEIAPIQRDSSPFDWSPDGTGIVFISNSSGRNNIWYANTDGSGDRMLTDLAEGTSKLLSPTWSPDGRRIAVVEAMGSGPAVASKLNRLLIHQDNTTTTIGEFSAMISLLGWSATNDGVYVARVGDRSIDILLVRIDGSSEPRTILQLPDVRRSSIRIAPNQESIAYAERRNNVDNLYVVALSGGRVKRVTSNDDPTLLYSGLTWTPDSKRLLYSKQTGGMQISLISDVRKGIE